MKVKRLMLFVFLFLFFLILKYAKADAAPVPFFTQPSLQLNTLG